MIHGFVVMAHYRRPFTVQGVIIPAGYLGYFSIYCEKGPPPGYRERRIEGKGRSREIGTNRICWLPGLQLNIYRCYWWTEKNGKARDLVPGFGECRSEKRYFTLYSGIMDNT
jgi:hypothetical protein